MARTSTSRAARLAALALLATLSPAALAAGPAEAAPNYKPWGRAWSADKVLRPGCREYRINYRVTVPGDEWSAEIFIINPNGRFLRHFAKDAGANPKRGKARFTLCRRSTVYGKHRIKMKVTRSIDRDVVDAWVRPTKFRFTRP